MDRLHTVAETNALIAQGKILHIAGDEAALGRLRTGTWIGGTIPYFLTAEGGVVDRERVLVTELPAEVKGARVRFVDAADLADIPGAAFEHGFSLVVIPGMSDAHAKYANEIGDVPGLFEKPIAGWIAGVHLDDLGKVKPKVFNGRTGQVSDDKIVVLSAELPEHVMARIGIINLFAQGDGDRIEFPETGFSADACRINGKPGSFYDYVKARQLDQKMPLVADHSGEMINVSFQALDDANRRVLFYAPVMSGIEYRHAAPVGNYRQQLLSHLASEPVTPLFSCNCILNYLFAGLEGDQPIAIGGPATFGEIAYVLLNQTLVYLQLDRLAA
jgi:uncharacterized protein DUF6976